MSFIYIARKIAEPDKVNLYNNSVSQFFKQVRFEINGVDRTCTFRITSSIKDYLLYVPDEYYSYENAAWTFKDNNVYTEY